MSSSKIPASVRIRVAAKAAGRCSFRGCNKALTAHELTGKSGNYSAFAHIIADSPQGPRGDRVLSPQLAKEESNILLLCHGCHKLIDDNGGSAYPVELLRDMKAEHEQRIARLVDIAPDARTRLVTVNATVGSQRPVVDPMEVRRGLTDRYVVGEPLQIQFALREVTDRDSVYWGLVRGEVRQALETQLWPLEANQRVGHITLAGIAPIPSLIDLGAQIGDLAHVDTRVLLRAPKGWAWDDSDPTQASFNTIPSELSGPPGEVIVRVSLSAVVSPVPTEISDQCCRQYHLLHGNPGLDRMRTRAHRDAFRTAWANVLTAIAAVHGNQTLVHVFAAVPNAAAIEMGRVRLPKAHPPLALYDYNHACSGWIRAFTLGA